MKIIRYDKYDKNKALVQSNIELEVCSETGRFLEAFIKEYAGYSPAIPLFIDDLGIEITFMGEQMETQITELKQYIRDLHILASEMRIYCFCEASEQVVFEFRQLEKDIAEKYKGLLCL
jgi:hypothetical protein